jgi:hypothetical protein
LPARLARDGWTLGFRDTTSLVVNANRNADLGSTAATGCFSVRLGLLHALSSRRTIRVEATVARAANGTMVTINGSRSGNSVLRYIDERLRDLPKSRLAGIL